MKELPMKIAVVNIGRTYANTSGHYESMYALKIAKPKEGPWRFDFVRTKYHLPKFLVAIDYEFEFVDSIEGCYNVIDLCDKGDDGVTFDLSRCSPEDEAYVRSLVKDKDFKGVSYRMIII